VRLAYANAHGALCTRLYPSRNAAWVLKQRDKGASRKAPEKGANQPKDGRLRPNICTASSHPPLLFTISQSRPAHYPAVSGRFLCGSVEVVTINAIFGTSGFWSDRCLLSLLAAFSP